MSRTISTLVLASAALAAIAAAHAQPAPTPAEQELLRNGEITLTRADWDADMLRVPADQRTAFVTSAQRVQSELYSLIVAKTLAARARRAGLENDPLVQRRIALETDRILATAMLDKVEVDARAEFDRKGERNIARARELYLVDAKRFAVPEQVDASHILFSTKKHSPEQALAAAKEARAKLLAGAEFAALARELSEDPATKRNGGRLGNFTRGAMDRAFEDAAFAQTQVGEISEPVLSQFGYHLIRHEGRTAAKQLPFADVEAPIIGEMRRADVQRAREEAVNGIRGDPNIVVNQSAVDSLVVEVPAPPKPKSAPARKPAS